MKVLFISDGVDVEQGAFEFIKEINRRSPVFLYGIFLPKRSLGYWLLRAGSFFLLPPYNFQTEEKLIAAACRFSDLCREHHINHSSYSGRGEAPLLKLRRESRYADYLVVSYTIFQQKNKKLRKPRQYLSRILHHCECPVIVVPDQFVFPSKNIIAFDASASSVYALKQFFYLLPDLGANSTILVNVGANNNKNGGLNKTNLESLTINHYHSLDPTCLRLNTANELSEWVVSQQAAILVAGACGRSRASQLIKRSFLSGILKDKRMPLFVAHR